MSVLHFSVFILIVIVIGGNAETESLTSFSKKVKDLIPGDVFKNLYSVAFTNKNDFKQAVKRAVSAFSKDIGVNVPAFLNKAIDAEAEKAAEKQKDGNVTPSMFFQIFTNTVGDTLKLEDLLNASNENSLVKTYADALIKAEKTDVQKEDVFYTFPAVAGATAKFLSAQGISGKLYKILPFVTNFLEEARKVM